MRTNVDTLKAAEQAEANERNEARVAAMSRYWAVASAEAKGDPIVTADELVALLQAADVSADRWRMHVAGLRRLAELQNVDLAAADAEIERCRQAEEQAKLAIEPARRAAEATYRAASEAHGLARSERRGVFERHQEREELRKSMYAATRGHADLSELVREVLS